MLKWRLQCNRDKSRHITITDIIIRACALALANFPRLNAHVDDERVVLKRDVNIGVATIVEDGLLLPVIPNADKKSLPEISDISRRNSEAARRGFVNAKSVGSFTVSTLGSYSIREYLPIINPPECAILAVRAVEQRVVPRGGTIAVRDLITVVLSCDHRAIDGVYAARFLNCIKAYLEKGFSNDTQFTM